MLAVRGHTLFLFHDGVVETLDVHGASGVEPGDLVAVRDGAVVTRIAGPGQWPPPEGHPAAELGAFVGGRWGRLKRRGELLAATRAWFGRAGFTEVETPLIVASPGTETHLDPVGVRYRASPGKAEEDAWLITSPEYAMKKLLVAGAGPIYQLGRVFRDGERGARHRPEFTMLEWYRPWVDDGYAQLFGDCEGLIRTLAGGERLEWNGRTFDLSGPWRRLRFFDVLEARGGLTDPRRLDPDAWFAALVEKVEPTLGADAPEFLTEWPMALASLARRAPHDPEVAERFELYLGGLELANAFAELTDAEEQRARCVADNVERAALGRPTLPLDETFLGALSAGMPPSAGIALGFDRLAMLLTGVTHIDDISSFS